VYNLGCFAVRTDNFQPPQTFLSDLDPNQSHKMSRSGDSTGRLHHFFLQTFNPETLIIWHMAGEIPILYMIALVKIIGKADSGNQLL
jgi:hypothetical protein